MPLVPRAVAGDDAPLEGDLDDAPPADGAEDDIDDADAADAGGDRSGGPSNGERRRRGKAGGKRSAAGEGLAARVPWGEPLALVRYGRMSKVELFRHALDPAPRRDTRVVIRTERGVELGTVVGALKPGQAPPPPPPVVEGGPDDPPPCGSHNGCTVSCGQVENLLRAGGTELSFNRQNKILRLASPQDVNDQEHLDRNEREKRVYCGQQARELGLRMRLVTVEHLLGGERVVFYFTSDSRVDFRELVRRLAAQYRTRIEMRQIGARDEARLVADYERCGQRCCCQAFLGTLQPVSIRMAKVQKATLDPSKISGRCNRLMCCLRYEDETYEFLRRQLPRKNTWVRTADVVGKVVAAQLLTQLVRLIDAEGTMVVVENAAILERDVTAPPPGTTAPRPERRPSRPQRPAAPVEAPVEPAGPPEAPGAETGGEESSDAATKRRRRRRRRRKPDAPGAEAAPPADGGTQAPDGAPRKKRRRRRRRGKAEGEADNAPPAEG